MNENVKRRRYRSPLREQQAMDTQASILDAAQSLFIKDGYGATSIRAVADEAGVSEATVYAVYGQKAAILWAALLRAVMGDDEESPTGLPENLVRSVRASSSIGERAQALIRWSRRHWERGAADLEVALERAADTDTELTEMVDRAAEGRLQAVRDSLNLALEVGSLREGLTFDDAVDLIWAIDSPQVYRALVRARGWSPEKYEGWLIELISRLLLPEES